MVNRFGNIGGCVKATINGIPERTGVTRLLYSLLKARFSDVLKIEAISVQVHIAYGSLLGNVSGLLLKSSKVKSNLCRCR